MDLRLVFLGTSGAVPTIDRGPSAILLIRGGERMLIDCGEGTQRQLMRSAGLGRIDRIFLTHLHGDHYLGLPGLLKTLSLMGREETVRLYGPPGTAELFQVAHRIFGRFGFPLEITEVTAGVATGGDGYTMEALPTEHGLPSIAWIMSEQDRPGLFHPERALDLGVAPGPDFGRLQRGEEVVTEAGDVVSPEQVMDEPRPGRMIVMTGDTRPSDRVAAAATGADVLVHDATFTGEEGQRARETRHSTAGEAAGIAAEAGVGLLVLTHVSSRHSRRALLSEARRVFPNVILPDDLDHLVVPYADKGEPSLIRGGDSSVIEQPEGAQEVLPAG